MPFCVIFMVLVKEWFLSTTQYLFLDSKLLRVFRDKSTFGFMFTAFVILLNFGQAFKNLCCQLIQQSKMKKKPHFYSI